MEGTKLEDTAIDITQSEQWKETREEVSASGTCGTIRKDLTSK